MCDLPDRLGVEEMQLLSPLPLGAHEVRRLEDRQVLTHRLPRHRKPCAQLAQTLSVLLIEAVEESTPARIGQP